jgi:trigger factor
MITTVEKVSSNRVKIHFEMDAATFEESLQKTYLRLRGRMQVPGFRKGKAPRKLIENMYGENFFCEEALEALFPDAYSRAVKENELDPVDLPSLEVEQMRAGQPLIFSAEIFVSPEVTLGPYKGLEIPAHEHPVTDEDVDREVQRAQRKVSRLLQIEEEPAKWGDQVTLSYAGSIDGMPFEGGAAESVRLPLGDGQFISGFEEQVAGMRAGETRDVTVRFPEDYFEETVAGKEAVFHVELHGIQREEVPELDDDFVRDVSEFDTVDAYKADIRVKLEAEAVAHSRKALENAALDAAVAGATVDIPEPMIVREAEMLLSGLEADLASQNKGIQDFFNYTGMTEDSLTKEYLARGERRIRTRLVLEAICEAEGIEPSPEEIDEAIRRVAEGREDIETFKQNLSPERLDNLTWAARAEKAVKLIADSAVVTPAHEHEHEHHGHEHTDEHA